MAWHDTNMMLVGAWVIGEENTQTIPFQHRHISIRCFTECLELHKEFSQHNRAARISVVVVHMCASNRMKNMENTESAVQTFSALLRMRRSHGPFFYGVRT